MSIIQTFPFDDQVNYTQSGTEIAADKAKLSLIPNPGQTFSENFASSVGFTYDSVKAEFVGGVVRQKSQVAVPTLVNVLAASVVGNQITKTAPGNAWSSSGANSSAIITGDGYVQWSVPDVTKGSMCGLTTNPNIAGDYTQLDYGIQSIGGTAYIYESGVLITTIPGVVDGDVYAVAIESGVVKSKINGVVVYTSLVSPTYPLYLGIALYTASAVVDSLLMRAAGADYVGNTVDLPAFSYTGVGTILSVQSATITEIGTPKYIVGGFYWNGSAWAISDGSYAQANTSATVIANLTALNVSGQTTVVVSIVFQDSNTQSSVDLISVSLTGQKYPLTGYLEPVQALQVQNLLSYTQTDIVDADTRVLVILKIDGVLTYFDGASWVASDGTEAQANTAAEVDAAVGSLSLGANSSIFIRWLLVTDLITKTPEIDEAEVSYNFGAIATTPAVCEVYGYVRDVTGAPVANVLVLFTPKIKSGQYVEAPQNIILKTPISTTTDTNGYFTQSLIRSSEFDTLIEYSVSIGEGSDRVSKSTDGKLVFTVPDADTKDITDLFTGA